MATSENTGKGGSLRDEQKRLTRRLLIEGAVTAFERKGYAATTIEDIVAEANASRASPCGRRGVDAGAIPPAAAGRSRRGVIADD